MIDYASALQRLLDRAVRLPGESCALANADGRLLAQHIRSPIALPSFDHAAMDGYALAARESLPEDSEHRVVGSQAAGDAGRDGHGGAWEIMTGARVPHGLDAVIAVERTQMLEHQADGTPQRIRLRDTLGAGHNVRRAGSDIAANSLALGAGTRLNPAHLMLLAALGVAAVPVVRRARVAIVGTGKELVDDPGHALADGQIYASNGAYLAAALAGVGANVISNEIVDDSALTYAAALNRAMAAGVDLVISTGAVSMGRYDFVPQALRELGAEALFHGVAIRPGRPLLAAYMPNGTPVLALPGTPMAVAVGLRFFVAPLLRAMGGQGAESPLRAVLDTPQRPKPGLRHFLRVSLHQDGDGRVHASVPAQQQPFRIAPFAQTDAWAVFSDEAEDCRAGCMVDIVSLHPGMPPAIHRSELP